MSRTTGQYHPCVICGKLVYRAPSEFARKNARFIFCSKTCHGIHQTGDLYARLWSKIDTSGGADVCWPWTGGLNAYGYGVIGFQGTTFSTHRLAYEFVHGLLLPGICVLHHCDFRPCANPYRCLHPGTRADNVREAASRQRMPHGESNFNARLTEHQVRTIWRLKGTQPIKQIAAQFHVTPGTVIAIYAGQTWKHIKDT